MQAKPYILREVSFRAVQEHSPDLAVLPWGATEAHNLHLPYGTDTFEAEHIAVAAAGIAWTKGAKVMVLPGVPYGVNTGQMDIPFVINMNPGTQTALLADIVQSLSGQGIKKMVIVNGHGGNDFKPAIREISLRFRSFFIATLNWWEIIRYDGYFDEAGDHGGEMETSVMMYIRPDLILPLDQAGEGRAKVFRFTAMKEGWAWAQREWSKVTQDTGIGNPKAASADKGEKYLQSVIDNVARFFIELAATPLQEIYE